MENRKKEFNDWEYNLQPYNYERYKAVNPKLTKRMYEYLRGNGSEWKILCGVEVKIKYENEILEEVWHRNLKGSYKESIFYKFRYIPSYYLQLEW